MAQLSLVQSAPDGLSSHVLYELEYFLIQLTRRTHGQLCLTAELWRCDWKRCFNSAAFQKRKSCLIVRVGGRVSPGGDWSGDLISADNDDPKIISTEDVITKRFKHQASIVEDFH